MTLSRLSFFSACRSPSFVLFTSCAPLHCQCGDPKPRGLMSLFALLLRTSWVFLSLIKFTGKLASPRVGGFGLRRAVDHAEIAFSASWHEAQATCHEPW